MVLRIRGGMKEMLGKQSTASERIAGAGTGSAPEYIRLGPTAPLAGCAGKRSPCSRPSTPPPDAPGCGKSPAFLWESCAGSWCGIRVPRLSKE